MRRLPLLFALGVGATSGAYTIIYLYRWEWNRAMIAGLFFLATEVVMSAALITGRLRTLERRLDVAALGGTTVAGPTGAGITPLEAGPTVLERIREGTPPPRDHFAWLRDQTGSLGVFLPVLLGAGVLASGLAWLVEQVARSSAGPILDRRLVAQLAPISVPSGDLLDVSHEAAPASRPRHVRSVVAVALLAVTGMVTATGLDFLADRIQTRPDVLQAGTETLIELEMRGEVADRDPGRILGHLWATCTGPDVFKTRRLPAPVLLHGVDGQGSVRIATDIGEHGLDRLTGCLNDTTLEKVQARVVRVTLR